MENILKVRLGGQELALTYDAYNTLSAALEEAKSRMSPEELNSLEANIAQGILSRQAATTVVNQSTILERLSELGINTPAPASKKSPKTDPNTTSQSSLGPLGRVLITILKVIGWIMGVTWSLCAVGVLIGFIVLLSVESYSEAFLYDYSGGISPILFCGLVCAVVVIFMAIAAVLWFKLLLGKRVNLTALVISSLVWLALVIWLTIASLLNIEGWMRWADTMEIKVEQWEDGLDRWEDELERWEDNLERQLSTIDFYDNGGNVVKLSGFEDSLKFELLCEKYEELEPWEDDLSRHIRQGGEVTIEFSAEDENTASITVISPEGTITIRTQK